MKWIPVYHTTPIVNKKLKNCHYTLIFSLVKNNESLSMHTQTIWDVSGLIKVVVGNMAKHFGYTR